MAPLCKASGTLRETKLHRLPFKEALSSCRVTRNSDARKGDPDGATLPEMLFHYIRPEHDEDLQSNRMDLKEVMESTRRSCVLKDPEGFEAACEAFEFDEMKPDEERPYLFVGPHAGRRRPRPCDSAHERGRTLAHAAGLDPTCPQRHCRHDEQAGFEGGRHRQRRFRP